MSANPVPEESVTARVLRELGADGTGIEDADRPPGLRLVDNDVPHPLEYPEEEDELHIDERWLVSYADMMTLLFGLFVMLYAMAGSFEAVKSSTAKRFGGPLKASKDGAVREDLRVRFEGIQRELKHSGEQKRALHTRINSLVIENAQLKETISELDGKSEELEEELSRTHARLAAMPSSLTVVLKWSTQQHDLDLVVKDPQGHEYNFKHRRHVGSPGNLVLDSRHGPGAELWQADKILPGVYEVTAVFYNPYGNPEPAAVSLSILTAHGSVEVPETHLTFEKSPRKTLRFMATANGSVKLLK